ncbi:MAG: sulfatase-like hydrolase/transferase [Planctomycetes bacterium]|nr:sulfatase-like hydrolase/transferase [Planctomycetota bacterium]MBL7144561.1 sulfatase-like hydrolase/transferase [Phycisphaerae bacterium]
MLGRREFLKTFGFSITYISAYGWVKNQSVLGNENLNRPNIIFIFSDQQRWDTVGCYGSPLFDNLTPNLDLLARKGVCFEYAFTCQPVCGPARSCLQTGKYATETGCYRNGISLPENEKTIAHWLSDAGYEVGYLGKWHLASMSRVPGHNADYRTKAIPQQLRGGYRDFWLASDVLEFTSHSYDGHMFDGDGNKREFPNDRYRVDAQTDWALEYLDRRNRNKPFFLFISYIEPHHQNDHNQFEGPRGSKKRFADYKIPGDLAGTKGDWRKEMPDYLGCCWSLDQNVGRIQDKLKQLGIADNTLLIYTSDHGCHFRTRNSEYKRSCHDNTIHIPLIIHGPGFTGGKVISKLVSLIDLPPTVLQAGNVRPPDYMRGRALQQLLDSKADDWPKEVFVQISESQVGRAVRTKTWKYSVRANNKNGGRDSCSDEYMEDKLYDLNKDPYERRNLVDDPTLAEVRAKLAKILKRRMAAAGENEPAIVPYMK